MRMGSRVTGSSRGRAGRTGAAISGRGLGARTVIAAPSPAGNDRKATAAEAPFPAAAPSGRGTPAGEDGLVPRAPTPWAAAARRRRSIARDETRERKRATGPRELD